MKKNEKKQKIPRTEMQMMDGVRLLGLHPFFSRLGHYRFLYHHRTPMGKDAAVIVNHDGELLFNPKADYTPKQWSRAAAHAMLHCAFGHFDMEKVPGREVRQNDGKIKKVADFDQDLWNAACDIYINRFLDDIHFGEKLHNVPDPVIPAAYMGDELSIYHYLKEQNWPPNDHGEGTNDREHMDMDGLDHPVEYYPNTYSWSGRKYNLYAKEFALALSHSVSKAVILASGCEGKDPEKRTEAQKAAAWFLNHYPLLGGMAASFQLKEDFQLCRRCEIQVAAVDAEEGEIYINPAAGLSEEEWKFVLAHEFLHAGLQHHKRQQGRDPYLWNVACDFVINEWLTEMQVGSMPEGVLYDPELKGLSAEQIYDRIQNEARRYKKENTFRGYGKGDVLCGADRMTDRTRGVSLDDFFRNTLMAGLEYQQETMRGIIPAGLAEEIRSLAMPPIRWDVKLANWFDENILPKEKHRSYARPSRRQACTPGIPRPRYVLTEAEKMGATFGVVIDTSCSMSAEDIGKALGSIASYAASKDVPAARVVFCDAEAYDAGYLETGQIAGRVKVVGRGGTRLQPGISLLEKATDFPKDGPILIITDGWVEDHMDIRRKHAFLLPAGRRLPFTPKGEVFYFE